MKKNLFSILVILILVVSVIFGFCTKDFTTKLVSYNGENLRISIDGASASTLPTSGNYYLVDYDCKNTSTELNWDRKNYTLEVTNGIEKNELVCNLEFKSAPLLSEMPVGSYVKYSGDNGCSSTNIVNGYSSCDGKNENYESDLDMGYCSTEDYRFYTNGWRLGYVDGGNAHLISAGAVECLCTNSNGSSSNSTCSTSVDSYSVNKHYTNMNNIALKYCNSIYAKDGICDSNTAWAVNGEDFNKMTKNTLNSSACTQKNNFACGYTNDLIDNGGYYWFASNSSNIYYWYPFYRRIASNVSSETYGVRPILKIDSTVNVVDGDGTYDSPYLISSNYFDINDGDYYINSYDNRSSVQLTLHSNGNATDMCISTNTSVCTNYVSYSDTYSLNWSSESDGQKTIYVYYKDSSGNIIASMSKSIVIDTVAPTNNSISISDGSGTKRTLTLSSTGASYMCFSNTSSTSCDNWVKYATSDYWTLTSGSGTKTVYAFFKDEAGNISASVSDSTSISYKYFMKVISGNGMHLVLVRSDGASAYLSLNSGFSSSLVSDVVWAADSSGSMKKCTFDQSDLSINNGYIWCVGDDNNVYYKSVRSQTWNTVLVSDYLSGVSFDIWSESLRDRLYVVSSNGKVNYVDSSGIFDPYWSLGETKNMVACGGRGDSIVTCVGGDGYFYYKKNFLSGFSAYDGGKIRVPSTSLVFVETNGSNVGLMVSNGSSFYSSIFEYSASSTTWTSSSFPGREGNSGIKACTLSFGERFQSNLLANNIPINICLGIDNYIYYKNYNATSWTSTGVKVEI